MTVIYYFSGSGNSLAVARDLASRMHADLESMTSHAAGIDVPDGAGAVGFVFPSHDFQAPAFVRSWMSRVQGLAGKYVFAVMTYGISPGRGLGKFAAVVTERGGRLAAGFAVMMPHNGIGSRLQPPDVRERLIEQWRSQRNRVAEVLRRRDERAFESEFAPCGFFRNASWKMLPGLFRFIGVMIRDGEGGLFYNADETCNGCGVCARVCPVGNIRMADRRPEWRDSCINCFACLHWCPVQATHLSTRDLQIDHRYHHPDVAIGQMTG